MVCQGPGMPLQNHGPMHIGPLDLDTVTAQGLIDSLQILVRPGTQDRRQGAGRVICGAESEAWPCIPHATPTGPFFLCGSQRMAPAHFQPLSSCPRSGRPGPPENLSESGFPTYPLLSMAMGLLYSILHAHQYQGSGWRQICEWSAQHTLGSWPR